jgi:hypothetical protein
VKFEESPYIIVSVVAAVPLVLFALMVKRRKKVED